MAFEPIVAEPIKEETFLKAMSILAKQQAKFSDTQFGLTYKIWEHKPNFLQSVEEKRNQIIGSTLTSGDGSKDNPYPFVTRGTSVRFATMTPDFSPKSTPRVIGSKGGRGGVAYIDKRRPRPGIQAREFEPEIAEREQPKFIRRGQAALDRAAKRSGHSI